jgi:hypothetical protein
VWRRLGEIDADWHVWQEQIARIAIGTGDLEVARDAADAAITGGHLCPWAFATRAQLRLCTGDRDGARADLERAWAIAEPQSREHEAHDVWAARAALAGRGRDADDGFARYLREPGITDNDRQRIARLREALALG